MTNEWYRQRLVELRREFGGKCYRCESEDHLEFHHKDQKFLGPGRGRNARVLDILKHRDKFLLVCRKCHRLITYGHY